MIVNYNIRLIVSVNSHDSCFEQITIQLVNYCISPKTGNSSSPSVLPYPNKWKRVRRDWIASAYAQSYQVRCHHTDTRLTQSNMCIFRVRQNDYTGYYMFVLHISSVPRIGA